MDFVRLKPPTLRARLENVFRRYEAGVREPEGGSERDINLSSSHQAEASARVSTPESSTVS